MNDGLPFQSMADADMAPASSGERRKRRFIQCDVFSAVPGKGNGLAVVLDAEGLGTGVMQDFASWTNLAETAFVLPPTTTRADYRVRIFSPKREMPFAGHPTLGTCAAWLYAGGQPKRKGSVRQECAIGVVPIDVRDEMPFFRAPETKVADIPPTEFNRCLDAMGIGAGDVIRAAHLDNGRALSVFELRDANLVLDIDASHVRYPDFDGVGLIGRQTKASGSDYEARMLAPASGAPEDPITGSLNAAIGCWLYGTGAWTGDKIVAQGTRLDREGRVHFRQKGADVWVGGGTNILIDGTVEL